MPKLPAVALVAVFVAACAGPAATPSPAATVAGTPAPPSAPAATPQASEPPEAETLRQLAFAYWDAYNAYDVDRVLSYLEPGERAKREATIRDEIGRLRTFGVKLGISEQGPPVRTGAGAAEMLLTMKEPLGSRTMKMAFLLRDGRWLITAADEVPE